MTNLTLNMRMLATKITLAGIILLFASPSFAAYAITGSELMVLPSFCRQLTPGNFAPDAKRYRVNAPEPTWMQHFQHYCHGLKSNVRASKALNKTDRNFNLNAAVGEFDYVLTHTQPIPRYFSYLAMVRVDLGRTYIHMGKTNDAIMQFTKASRLRPDFTVAYLELIDVYIKINDRDKALNAAREGLTHSPESKALQTSYRELGGKLPYPTPAQSTTANETEQKTAHSTPSASADQEKGPQMPTKPSAPSADKPAPRNPEPQGQKSKIGSPTNPWCRFCPPSDIVDPKQSPAAP